MTRKSELCSWLYRVAPVLAAALAALNLAAPVSAQQAAAIVAGPAKGALVIVGGGGMGQAIRQRFMELAGGERARIVVLPGAGTQDTFPPDWSGLRMWRDLGAAEVTVLHTRDPKVADTEEFVEPLRNATAVWIPGGRQWKLTIAYNGTRTLRELHAVLERGGVIGGSSAGASVQSSYMVRGAEEGNDVMMAPGHEEGFGFLRGAAVDQHILARGRQNDLGEVIVAHPELLGIGIDEGTAIVVQGNRAEVIGTSYVAFHNTKDAADMPYYFLKAGDAFDLAQRVTVKGTTMPPEAGDQRMILATLNRFFEGMSERDTTAVRRTLHTDARVFVAQEAGQRSRVESVSIEDFLKQLGASEAAFERRIEQPEIRVDGNLASVWAASKVYEGTRVANCGTDSYQLARSGQGGWRILQLAYTREDDCGSD
jgi:cyanophycinase